MRKKQSKWDELKDWIVATLGLTRKHGDLEVGMAIVLKKMFELENREWTDGHSSGNGSSKKH